MTDLMHLDAANRSGRGSGVGTPSAAARCDHLSGGPAAGGMARVAVDLVCGADMGRAYLFRADLRFAELRGVRGSIGVRRAGGTGSSSTSLRMATVLQVGPELLSDVLETGASLAVRAEPPLCAMAVELTEDDRGFGGGVLAEVVAGHDGAAGLVHQADVGVPDLPEVLLPVSASRMDTPCTRSCRRRREERPGSRLICSSSPSPAPLVLSPVSMTDYSGVDRFVA